tara:strand:- start:114 stop:293 length:180 start_codon:yes stop_codon:yes gene_type:complete
VVSDNHLNKEEIRLEVLRIVKENGTENQKNNPLPIADEYYKWIVSGTIRKNPTDKKDRL